MDPGRLTTSVGAYFFTGEVIGANQVLQDFTDGAINFLRVIPSIALSYFIAAVALLSVLLGRFLGKVGTV
jgi:hypothetical protein